MPSRTPLYFIAVGVTTWICLSGCQSAPVSVKVKVTLDGVPVGNCAVKFVPDTETPDPQQIGYGYTDSNGECEVTLQMTGAKGLPSGTYKVTFEAWKDRRGKEVPPTAKPSEVDGGVIDRLPPQYKSVGTTPERLTVKGPVTHEFSLTGK
jgi:5-hydroxyisourate hydrolase-like protein (transthyretin family)